jgi:hypothetical protein
MGQFMTSGRRTFGGPEIHQGPRCAKLFHADADLLRPQSSMDLFEPRPFVEVLLELLVLKGDVHKVTQTKKKLTCLVIFFHFIERGKELVHRQAQRYGALLPFVDHFPERCFFLDSISPRRRAISIFLTDIERDAETVSLLTHS